MTPPSLPKLTFVTMSGAKCASFLSGFLPGEQRPTRTNPAVREPRKPGAGVGGLRIQPRLTKSPIIVGTGMYGHPRWADRERAAEAYRQAMDFSHGFAPRRNSITYR